MSQPKLPKKSGQKAKVKRKSDKLPAPEPTQRQRFEQLLDDAVFGVRKR